MKKNLFTKKQLRKQYLYLLLMTMLIWLVAFTLEAPNKLLADMLLILTSPSSLFTDYMAIASVGGALLNVGMMMLVSIITLYVNRIRINGAALASIGMLAGFSFFGKNLLNSLPIMFGVWLYTVITQQAFRNYVMISLFGTSLGPLVSYMIFGAGISFPWNIGMGLVVGLVVGVCLPALATQFLGFHQGFSLYNVGFTNGIIGMMIIGMMNAFGIEVDSRNLLYTGEQLWLYGFLGSVIGALLLASFYWHFEKQQPYQLKGLHQLSGRLPTDFLEMTNAATISLNSALLGILLTGYVYLNQATLNGPIVGGIIGVMSFAAFGNHLKNTVPVILGIVLGSYLTDVDPASTGVIVSGIFGTTLAPLSGYYGPVAGIVAGFVHITLVGHVLVLHAGLNLYNNGFAGGFVAAFLVPIFEIIESRRRR